MGRENRKRVLLLIGGLLFQLAAWNNGQTFGQAMKVCACMFSLNPLARRIHKHCTTQPPVQASERWNGLMDGWLGGCRSISPVGVGLLGNIPVFVNNSNTHTSSNLLEIVSK